MAKKKTKKSKEKMHKMPNGTMMEDKEMSRTMKGLKKKYK